MNEGSLCGNIVAGQFPVRELGGQAEERGAGLQLKGSDGEAVVCVGNDRGRTTNLRAGKGVTCAEGGRRVAMMDFGAVADRKMSLGEYNEYELNRDIEEDSVDGWNGEWRRRNFGERCLRSMGVGVGDRTSSFVSSSNGRK
jgi:hypothetical protein